MIELGNALLPCVSNHGNKIIEVLQCLPYLYRDNLAHVLASNSGDSELQQFDPALLTEMKDSLGLIFNTISWSDNTKQEERIAAALKTQSSLEGRIEKLMAKDRLTAKEIAKVRPLIAQLEQSKQAKYYLQIQKKVQYKNQRNNKSKATKNDIAKHDWLQGIDNPVAADIMCNFTSKVMALETVGISNPSEDMQFEDYLEKHRLEKYGDEAKRTESVTMINIAEDMGAQAKK